MHRALARYALASIVFGVTLAHAAPPPTAAPTPASDPIAERAQAVTEAASLLTKAGAALHKGNRNFADQLFSAAEIILGPAALADLAPQFREGAPKRITTPLVQLPKDTPAQPAVAGSSDEDAPPPKPAAGTLEGTLKREDGAAIGRSVVTLEPASGKFRAPTPKRRVMEQRDRQFAPKVMILPVGSTVTFPNFDPVYHNVFTRGDAPAFDLGIYKNGQARDFTFLKAGNYHLGCNLHANMAAFIVVVNAPHYLVSDADGHFKFRNLPPGRYTLKVWTDKSDAPQAQAVTIAANSNAVTLVVKSDLPARAAVDKFGAPRDK
jgi:plastocyanin